MTDPRLNQIRIKTGVLKSKREICLRKEVEDERKRLKTMKSQNKDEYDLRKQEEVINETLMMLPDSQKRIITAFNDLKAILQETELELSETKGFQVAKEAIKEVERM